MTATLLALAALLGAPGDGPAVVPRPAQMKMTRGSFPITPKTPVSAAPGLEALGKYLRERLALEERPGEAGGIVLALDGAAELGDEGYALVSSAEGVRIRAAKPAGVFYGIQTLVQLLPSSGEKAVPGVEITDRPRFPWRGYLLDPARHFRTKEYIKRTIDLLASYKCNVLQLHLTDDQGWRVEVRKYPKLAEIGAWRGAGDKRHGGFYTQDDLREIVAYAASRFVTVVPEIEMPGHSLGALTAYPEYSCTGGPFQVWTRWGVSEDILCAGSDGAFVFAQGVLEEVLSIFPSTFIHIGGDECPRKRWKACPKCQKRIQDEKLKDETELHGYFIRRMDAWLASKGRRLVGWDEILEGGLAPGATVMSWRGEKGGIAAANMGHDVVMSPTSHCYLDYPLKKISLEKAYSYEPVPAGIAPEKAKHVLGVQGNMWGEQTPQEADVDRMTWPRQAALAEVGWSPKEARDWADFSSRLQSVIAPASQQR
jgi:hexosaminidase